MHHTIPALMILAMACTTLGLFISTLTRFQGLTKKLAVLHREEQTLTTCAQHLADRQNYEEAHGFLATVYPEHKAMWDAIRNNLEDSWWPEEECHSAAIPWLQVGIRKENSERFSFSWPNWVVNYKLIGDVQWPR